MCACTVVTIQCLISIFQLIPTIQCLTVIFQLIPTIQCLTVIFQYLKLLRDEGPQERWVGMDSLINTNCDVIGNSSLVPKLPSCKGRKSGRTWEGSLGTRLALNS